MYNGVRSSVSENEKTWCYTSLMGGFASLLANGAAFTSYTMLMVVFCCLECCMLSELELPRLVVLLNTSQVCSY